MYGEIPEVEHLHRSEASNKVASKSAPANKSGSLKYVLISSGITVVVFGIIAIFLIFGPFKDKIFKDNSSVSSSSEQESSAPVVDKIGDTESGAENRVKLYPVPDFTGKYYSKIIEEEDYEIFKLEISDKKFSNKYPRGTVISQSIKEGEKEVPKDTEISLTLSLGPKEIEVPSVINKTEEEAIIELLKLGFIYENITVTEKYDPNAMPGVIIEQIPSAKEVTNTEINVEIFINTYEVEEEEPDSQDTSVATTGTVSE